MASEDLPCTQRERRCGGPRGLLTLCHPQHCPSAPGIAVLLREEGQIWSGRSPEHLPLGALASFSQEGQIWLRGEVRNLQWTSQPQPCHALKAMPGWKLGHGTLAASPLLLICPLPCLLLRAQHLLGELVRICATPAQAHVHLTVATAAVPQGVRLFFVPSSQGVYAI